MRNITYLERGPCIDAAHVAHINPSRVDFVEGNILRIQILLLMDIEMSQLFEIRNVTDLPTSRHHSSDLNYLWVKMTQPRVPLDKWQALNSFQRPIDDKAATVTGSPLG